MGFLRVLLDKIEHEHDDSLKKTFAKGMVEGVLDGLVIVGAVKVVANIIDMVKEWDKSRLGELIKLP